MSKVIVTFDLDINQNNDWINATEQQRNEATLQALKDLSNELIGIEVSQGVFTLYGSTVEIINN